MNFSLAARKDRKDLLGEPRIRRLHKEYTFDAQGERVPVTPAASRRTLATLLCRTTNEGGKALLAKQLIPSVT